MASAPLPTRQAVVRLRQTGVVGHGPDPLGAVAAKNVRPPAGALGPAKAIPTGKQHILNTQKFLASQGYHIAVDGVMGPQTRAAIADWHTGPKNRPMLSKHKEATNTVLAGRTKPPKPTSKPAPSPKGGGGGGRGGGGAGPSAPKSFDASAYKLIDPASYAKASTNAEFGPVIAGLLSDKAAATAQGASAQNDITGWINQLMQTQQQGAQGDANALAAAIQRNQTDTAGIESLFGNSGGHDLANTAANNLANIEARGQSTGDFDRHMAAVLQAQGVDQHFAAQQATAASLADIANKLQAQQAAKGSTYAKNLQDAYGTRLQQQAAIQNMQLAGQMAPVQLATAKANLAATKSRTKIAQLQAEQAGKAQALQNKITQAQLQQFKSTQGGKSIPFQQLQAGDRLKLTAAITKGIRSNILGSRMTKTAHGNHKVWGAIKAMLSPYDVSDPDVRTFALGILRQLSGHFTASNFK